MRYWPFKKKKKLKRMAKYYPHVKIEVIDKTRYTAVDKKLRHIITHWEIATPRVHTVTAKQWSHTPEPQKRRPGWSKA